MRLTNGAVTLCLLLSAPRIQAQPDSFFSEVVEVRVTNVDVIVTDRSGKPVTGLTREDFEIREDGVPKEISNFLELRGESAPSLTATAPETPVAPLRKDLRRRDITVFIDNTAIHPLRRNSVLPKLQEFLRQNVREQDTVAIAAWNNSLTIELQPTNDRAAIDAAVAKLQSASGFSDSPAVAIDDFHRKIAALIGAFADRPRRPGDPPQKPPWEQGLMEARAFGVLASHAAHQRVEALKSVIAWRRGVEGKKILVLLTGEMRESPADEAFLYLDASRDAFKDVNSVAITQARQYAIPSLADDIAAVANSAGVTLYPIDIAGKESGMPARDAASMQRIGTSGSTAHSRQALTLPAIAEETGGVALSGSDNWQLAFDTIRNDLESYYSLGYRATGPQEDRVKSIEVKVRKKGYTVRTRQAVVEKSLSSEMHDAVAANLFGTVPSNDLAIRATRDVPVPKDAETVVIPVTITIPMDKLTLVPEGTDLTGKVAMYAAFLRKDGAISKVAQQPLTVRFPAESLKRRKELTVKMDVTADATTTGISIGVMDGTSRATGFTAVSMQ